MQTGDLAVVREKIGRLWPKKVRPAVYLAGPVDGVSWDFAWSWRMYAKEVLEEAGYMVLNPLAGLDLSDCSDVIGIVEKQVADVMEATVVLAEADQHTAPYIGTAMEIRIAFEHGIPVLLWGKAHKRSVWLKYHADARFWNLDGALKFLAEEAEKWRVRMEAEAAEKGRNR
ncbi:MAG: hypothetical protein H5U02_00395 [Clostridia bacterium]|nr:hypothetical protein [Clostridia bacterium]